MTKTISMAVRKRRREPAKPWPITLRQHVHVIWPIVTTGEIASSDFLIKNTATIQKWQQSARHLAGVEMELAGVYEPARRWNQEYPILSVRGISDVVGLKRDEKWAKYASRRPRRSSSPSFESFRNITW